MITHRSPLVQEDNTERYLDLSFHTHRHVSDVSHNQRQMTTAYMLLINWDLFYKYLMTIIKVDLEIRRW